MDLGRLEKKLIDSDREVLYDPGRQQVISPEDAEQMIDTRFQGIDLDAID